MALLDGDDRLPRDADGLGQRVLRQVVPVEAAPFQLVSESHEPIVIQNLQYVQYELHYVIRTVRKSVRRFEIFDYQVTELRVPSAGKQQPDPPAVERPIAHDADYPVAHQHPDLVVAALHPEPDRSWR